MKIFDWQLISELSIWDTIVLQKHISGRKSMFYGKTLVYLGEPGAWYALFKMVHKVSTRGNRHWTSYEPEMHHLASVPLSMSGAKIDTIWDQVLPYGNSIKLFWTERNTNDFYKDITIPGQHDDYIELQIEIAKSDFAFIKTKDFKDFLIRQKILNLINREVITEILMPVAKRLRWESAGVYTRKATVELEQEFQENVITFIPELGPISYYQPVIIYKLHNWNFWDISNELEWQAQPLTFVKNTDPQARMTWHKLLFNLHNNPLYDECLVDVGQVINFTYYPTLPWYWEDSSTALPTKYWVLNKELTSSEDIEYVSQHESWTIVRPTVQNTEESTEGPTLSQFERMYEDLNNTTSVGDFTTGTSTLPYQALYRHTVNITPITPPASYDLTQWDTVYIKEEALWNKFNRKNREYTVLSYIGTNSDNEQVYKVQPTNKKTFNWEWSLDIRSKSLFKAEKILKRKFILEKDFWKYKAGQCFTKDEMIQIFGKFQDARDPFILNKLYICAE